MNTTLKNVHAVYSYQYCGN